MSSQLISPPIGDEEGKSYWFPFDLIPTKLETLNSPNSPCRYDEMTFGKCIHGYYADRLGCKLPWIKDNSVSKVVKLNGFFLRICSGIVNTSNFLISQNSHSKS